MENKDFELRLKVMLAVRSSRNEDYYKNAIKSTGIDIKHLTHGEIALRCAAMDAIEADLIIDYAKNGEVFGIEQVKLTEPKK